MSYEQMSQSSFIKEIKEVTYGAHPRKFCFVLGAGASRTSGIKSGQELVKIWDKDLRERNEDEYECWRKSLAITDDNMSSFYSQYYEKRFRRCRADGYNYIEKIMESAKPSAGYVMLAHMLTKTPHNVVITTNFDHLTEDAVNYYVQNTPLVIGHEFLAHYASGHPVRPTIIKIHRDLLFDPKNRSEDLQKLHDNWKTLLTLIFENYHPVFIGYAGNDKSLMDFLVENAKKFKNDEWKFPYWMLYKNDAVEGKVQEFLEQSDGFIIRHSGFDQVMIQLGAAFDYRIPTKDAFLEDAQKRYNSLSDAIDALSDPPKVSNAAEEASTDADASYETVLEYDPLDEEKDRVVQAIEQITSQSEVRRMYRDSVIHSFEGNYADAAAICKKLIEIEPENARYHAGLGNALYNLEDYEGALAEYNKAAEYKPEDESVHSNIATILEKLGQSEDALKEYSKVVELKPEDVSNHYKLAVALENLKQTEDALVEYRKVADLEPEKAVNHRKVAELLEKAEQYDDAAAEYRKAAELEPQNAATHSQLATVLEKLEQYEDALAEYLVASKLAPDDASAIDKAAKMLEKLGKYEDALSKYRKVLELYPRDAAAHFRVAHILEILGNDKEALEEYQNALKISPDDALNHFKVAELLEKMGRCSDALDEACKAVELDPKSADAHYLLARIWEKSELYQDALNEYNTALKLNPQKDMVHFKTALMLEKLERYPEALIEYQKAVELNPEDASNYNGVSMMLLKLESYDEALAAAQKAIALDPQSSHLYETLCLILRKLNRDNEAAEAAKKAEELGTHPIQPVAS